MNANERYTLEADVRAGAYLAGLAHDAADPRSIYALDPAACAESFWAQTYYTQATNGLAQPWFGDVFLNPPFDALLAWTKRIWQAANEARVQSVTYYIPGDRIEQPFWQDMIEPFRDGRDRLGAPFQVDVHNVKGRAKFGYPGNALARNVGSPPFKMAYVIFRRRPVGTVLPIYRLDDYAKLRARAA